MPKTLFFVCGERSGEAYAARVARAFRERFPAVPMEGIGSTLLAAEGVGLLRDYGDISVIGVTEALRRLPAIRAALSAATERVSRPDIGAVVLVDFPDFNFRVGMSAARRGVPVGKRAVGLLPGSRPGEVAAHLPILLSAADLLLRRYPDLHFALPVARPSLREAIASEAAGTDLPITLVDA